MAQNYEKLCLQGVETWLFVNVNFIYNFRLFA